MIEEKSGPYSTIDYLHQLDFLQLRKESDRGLVLIFSEYINEFLKRILSFEIFKNTKNNTIVEELVDDSRSLGTFSSRLHAIYGFGFLEKRAFYTIHFIRKIRNVFAHENTIIDLNSPHVEPFISELRKLLINEWNYPKENVEKETPRQVFGVICSLTIAFLYGVRHAKLEVHFGKKFDEIDNPGLANFWVKL